MTRLLGYELKKIVKRPFTLVVSLGCLAIIAVVCIYGGTQGRAFAWGPERYGSYEATPGEYLEEARKWGLEEGAAVYGGRAARELDRERTKPFEGMWDDARLQQMVRDYHAFLADPDIYLPEMDTFSMEMRRWSFLDQGMSETEVDAYDAAHPIYIMKPEVHYGEERQQWYMVSDLLETFVIKPDGTAKSFAEAFPLVEQPARFSYSAGPASTVEFQSSFVGLLIALVVLAGVSPIFCDEVTQNTEPMLLAAKYGRDRLVWAKLLAGVLFSLGAVLALSLFNALLVGAIWGFDGYGVPVQLVYQLAGMPFAMTIAQYLFMIIGFQAVGAVATACLLMLLSAFMRSAFPVLFAGGLFVLVDVFCALQLSPPWRYYAQALPPALFMPTSLIYDGTKNGLGVLPVAQWCMPLIGCAVSIFLSMVLITRRYQTKRD